MSLAIVEIDLSTTFNFLELPLICQVNVCVQSDEEVFVSLQYLTGLEHLFGYAEHGSKYSERIFEERTRRLYSDELVQLKTKDISWEYFYSNVRYIFNRILIDTSLFETIMGQCIGTLLEYQLIQFLRPNEFKKYKENIVDDACKYNSVELLEWLDVIPSRHAISLAILRDYIDVIKFLHKKDYEFTQFDLTDINRDTKVYSWFVENNYYPYNSWSLYS